VPSALTTYEQQNEFIKIPKMHPPFQINSPHWNYQEDETQEDETQKKQTQRNKLTNSNIITSPVSQS